MIKIYFLSLFINIAYLTLINCDEILIQINANHPINEVSDKYVSFSIDPKIINESVGGDNSETIDQMALKLSPAYLKIAGESFFKYTSILSNTIEIENDVKDNKPQDLLRNFNDWMCLVGWKPIIPLPYNPTHWDSMEVLRILNVSSALGIRNCIWQLGLNFNATGATNYIADLVTLQTMTGAFQEHVDDWSIIGADISSGSNPEETKLYVDLVKHMVEAVGWMPNSELINPETGYIVNNKDLALKNILNSKLPSWLSLPTKVEKYKNLDGCSVFCIREGLHWAQILGDAAQIGFKVVYKPLNINDFNEPNLNFYISLLFKQIMGKKVFETKLISGDKFTSRIYSHCAKEKIGGLALMAINMAETRSKMLVKFSSKSTGNEMWQYIITINNGNVILNDEPLYLNSTLEPFIKIKHPTRPVSIGLPPMSIGFWMLPHANHDECLKDKTTNNIEVLSNNKHSLRSVRVRTSSEKLLQQLIMKNAAAPTPMLKRKKRHITINKDSNYFKQRLNDFYPKINEKEQKRQVRFILTNQEPKSLEQYNGQKKLFKKDSSILQENPLKLENLTTNTKRSKRQIMGPGLRHNFPLRKKFGLRNQVPLETNKEKESVIINSAVPSSKDTYLEDNVRKYTFKSHSKDDQVFERKNSLNSYNLPEGDVHFKLTSGDGDYDYIAFEENPNKLDSTKVNNNNPEETSSNVPATYFESHKVHKVIPERRNFDEISEIIPKLNNQISSMEINQNRFPNDQHIPFITKELEPTYNENNEKLRQAHQQLQSYYLYSMTPKKIATTMYHNLEEPKLNSQTSSLNYNLNNSDKNSKSDEFFLNSRETRSTPQFYNNENTVSNIRLKRSICEKCIISNDKISSNKINKCKCYNDYEENVIKSHIRRQSRKRRNATVLKSISLALSNEYNAIPKQVGHETYTEIQQRKYLPYRIIPRDYHNSMRPQNYDDIIKMNSNRNTTNQNLSNVNNENNYSERLSNTEKRHINDPKPLSLLDNDNIIDEKPPKFMKFFSDKVSSLMDTINTHVTGWWNTWA